MDERDHKAMNEGIEFQHISNFINGVEFKDKNETELKLKIMALESEIKDQQEYISRLMSDRLNYTKMYMDEVHKLTQEINRLKNGK